jgi:hypothetical protein
MPSSGIPEPKSARASIPDRSPTYEADLEMNGLAKLLNPVLKLAFEKLASDTEKQLTTVLNELETKEQK